MDSVWTTTTEVAERGHRSALAWRDGVGTPLVLCHSVTLDHRMWAPVVGRLPGGVPVLAYDVRGHGPGAFDGPFDFAACALDLVAHLDRLGLDRVHLAGVSMGGAVAQEFAIRHGARLTALTLLATGPRGRKASGDRAAVTSRAGLLALVAPTLARWLTPAFVAAGGPWVDYVRDRIAGFDVGVWRAAWTALGERDVTAHLGDIAVPTRCVAARDDASTPVARMAELADAIPGGRLVEIAGPHLSPIEEPDAVAAVLADPAGRTS